MSRRTQNTPEMLEAGRVEAERVAYEMDGPYCDNCGATGAAYKGNSRSGRYCDIGCAARCRDLHPAERTPTWDEIALAVSREAK